MTSHFVKSALAKLGLVKLVLAFAVLSSLSLSFAGCGGSDVTAPAAPALVGDWRGVLASPGGELPFLLRVEDDGSGPAAVIVNAGEEEPVSRVEQEGEEVTFHFSWYDAVIEARFEDGGLEGEWSKTIPEGESKLPFRAHRGAAERFPAPDSDAAPSSSGTASAIPTVAGCWAVEFVDEDGTQPALGEFHQEGTKVEGTFLTPTGDYRFLEGSYEEGLLRLSTFDGAHAFLFHARARADGVLEGDFWSRDSYHATWTARPAPEDAELLPDPWNEVRLTNDEGRFSFSFPDLEGEEVSLEDERFQGKVVIVYVFGSWCPNCNDEAPVLAELHEKYRDQGLEIVGLAFEFSGDPQRDGEMVRLFGERHGLDHPLLLAGTSDKADAGSLLPDLSSVIAYPTTIFVGRDGKVRRIHSGFSGPGTGEHYEQLVRQFDELVQELLAETV